MTVARAKQPSLFPRRELGVLLHPTSLFGREDVGTLGREAFAFVDWLEQAGVTLWQILPLTPNGLHNSPYFSASAFAGNPWLIDLGILRDNGLLEGAVDGAASCDARIPFAQLPETKLPRLLAAAEAFLRRPDHPWQPAFEAFRAREAWLDYTAHFFALKEALAGAPWWAWEPELRTRLPAALARSRAALAHRIEVWEALLFFFEMQWRALKAYANGKGIRILGDLPIYVHHDSADVWRYPDQFRLDGDGRMTVQSGVPPDYFSATGPALGQPDLRLGPHGAGRLLLVDRATAPLCRADRHRPHRSLPGPVGLLGDSRRCARTPAGGGGSVGPASGSSRRSPSTSPRCRSSRKTWERWTQAVLELRDRNGLYGMRILQFGFDGLPDNVHRPDVFPEESIAYTGTHDNNTLLGWWKSLDAEQRAEVAHYYQFSPAEAPGKVVWSLIEAAIACRSRVAVIPFQDLLVLDERARMNDPARFVGNWDWRLPPDGLSGELARSLRRLRDHYR